MIHTFVFQVMKMAVSFIGHKTHLELVGWHNNEKLMLMGTPGQALLPALIFSVVLVVPVAALTYRWIEKPAMDVARHGLSGTSVGSVRRSTWARRRWFARSADPAPSIESISYSLFPEQRAH